MNFIPIIFLISILFGQEIPNEFSAFHKSKILFDLGKNWGENSIFGPIRWHHNKSGNDSLLIKSRFGIQTLFNSSTMLYGYGHFSYQKFFHGYIYSRIVNKPLLTPRYSGIPRDIKRVGFNSGETDLSGISYENNWLIFQFGRGRQSWGAGNDIQLAISENSSPYDYGMLDLDFGKLKVRYFNGYLETDSLSVSRFITGRGIEWNNNKNTILGLSEIVVYSGKNRTFDLAYFNPISSHLEIELNDKQNNLGTDSGNGIWQLSIDHLLKSKIRISLNYLIDEFVLDKIQKENNKSSSGAYSIKFVFIPNIENIFSLTTFYISTIKVGTNTFKHENGYNNFVNRKKPLGWTVGSDSRESKIGTKIFYEKSQILTNLSIGLLENGENNMINDLYSGYSSYSKTSFPSGNFAKTAFISGDIQWWIKPYCSLLGNIRFYKSDKNSDANEINLGLNIFFPLDSSI